MTRILLLGQQEGLAEEFIEAQYPPQGQS